MRVSRHFTSDTAPLVLQLVVPMAPSDAGVNQTIKALAVLADEVCRPKLARLTCSQPQNMEFIPITTKSGALPPGKRHAPDRMVEMVRTCGDHVIDLNIEGWDNVVCNGQRDRRLHYSCNGTHDMSDVVDQMSHIVKLVVRFDDLVGESFLGWRTFILRACRIAVAAGPVRCGSIDIIESRWFSFGDSFIRSRQRHSFLRSTHWSKWVASARRGESKVPWPSPAALVSAEAIGRCGGFRLFSDEMTRAACVKRSGVDQPVLDELPDGSAVVWLAHNFEQAVPQSDDWDWIDIDDWTVERSAAMYLRLQEMGLAL